MHELIYPSIHMYLLQTIISAESTRHFIPTEHYSPLAIPDDVIDFQRESHIAQSAQKLTTHCWNVRETQAGRQSCGGGEQRGSPSSCKTLNQVSRTKESKQQRVKDPSSSLMLPPTTIRTCTHTITNWGIPFPIGKSVSEQHVRASRSSSTFNNITTTYLLTWLLLTYRVHMLLSSFCVRSNDTWIMYTLTQGMKTFWNENNTLVGFGFHHQSYYHDYTL